jgi:hypothetical protein
MPAAILTADWQIVLSRNPLAASRHNIAEENKNVIGKK